MNKKNILILALLLVIVFVPFVTVGAYTPDVPSKTLVGVDEIGGVEGVIGQILGIMQTILFAIAGVFVVVAGYQYLTAQGDPEKTANARNMILYAVIAIGIGLLATFLSTLVQSLLNAQTAT
jgi:hypothetical protein